MVKHELIRTAAGKNNDKQKQEADFRSEQIILRDFRQLELRMKRYELLSVLLGLVAFVIASIHYEVEFPNLP